MSSIGKFTLWSDKVRAAACREILAAPKDARVSIDPPRRTTDQNAKLHAMLRDVMKQHPVEVGDGHILTEDEWKQALMAALGHKARWITNPFDFGAIRLAPRTSTMTVAECSDAVEQLYASGTEWGVVWSEPEVWHKKGE